jgi:hypothetical protein
VIGFDWLFFQKIIIIIITIIKFTLGKWNFPNFPKNILLTHDKIWQSNLRKETLGLNGLTKSLTNLHVENLIDKWGECAEQHLLLNSNLSSMRPTQAHSTLGQLGRKVVTSTRSHLWNWCFATWIIILIEKRISKITPNVGRYPKSNVMLIIVYRKLFKIESHFTF